MKRLLFLLCIFVSATVQADTPPLSPEQTVRQFYQPYIESTPVATFGGTMVSARMGQALTLDERLALPGDMGWLDYDPICNCQDFDNLVLEKVAITQKDPAHAEATVRVRPFRDMNESVTQTLSLIMENQRWVIDDVISEQGSLYQQLNASNQQTLAALAALQRERAEDFIRALFDNLSHTPSPWTWVVSPEYRRATENYQRAVSRMGADRSYDDLFLYHNPLCDCIETQFVSLNTLSVEESDANHARIQVQLALGENETAASFNQVIVLQRIEEAWTVADVVRSPGGSLLAQMRAATARIEKE